MTDDRPNERDLFGNEPEPLTPTDWVYVGIIATLGFALVLFIIDCIIYALFG